jgi:D-glucosaminate-6-phosphate ammonia-lyase
MTNNGEENVYARLGARPVINAAGNTTVWGGSTPSPVVMQAMQEAGQSFVAMEELLETSGARIADLLGGRGRIRDGGLLRGACIEHRRLHHRQRS